MASGLNHSNRFDFGLFATFENSNKTINCGYFFCIGTLLNLGVLFELLRKSLDKGSLWASLCLNERTEFTLQKNAEFSFSGWSLTLNVFRFFLLSALFAIIYTVLSWFMFFAFESSTWWSETRRSQASVCQRTKYALKLYKFSLLLSLTTFCVCVCLCVFV